MTKFAKENDQVEAANKNLISIIKRKTKRNPKNWHGVLGECPGTEPEKIVNRGNIN
jgi:hypothetical protein